MTEEKMDKVNVEKGIVDFASLWVNLKPGIHIKVDLSKEEIRELHGDMTLLLTRGTTEV